MSDSYPTIQDSLSAVQIDFMGCVEMHLDPPETDDVNYSVEALYRQDDPDSALPGDTVRFAIAVKESDEDVAERRHTIEFVDHGEPVAHIRHSLKRVEAGRGQFFWTESRFEVTGPGVPHERALEAEVELEVCAYLTRLKKLDRARRLVQVA